MSDELRRFISARVLAARDHGGLTQERLAEMIERSVEAISNIERGVSLPSVDTLDRIAKAADVPISFFFEDTAEERINSEAILQLSLIVRKLRKRDAGLLVDLARSMESN